MPSPLICQWPARLGTDDLLLLGEPSLEALLSDDIARLLMAADGTDESEVMEIAQAARRRLDERLSPAKGMLSDKQAPIGSKGMVLVAPTSFVPSQFGRFEAGLR